MIKCALDPLEFGVGYTAATVGDTVQRFLLPRPHQPPAKCRVACERAERCGRSGDSAGGSTSARAAAALGLFLDLDPNTGRKLVGHGCAMRKTSKAVGELFSPW